MRLQSRELHYNNPAMNGVIPKHLIHRLFPNSKFNIRIDAKIQLTVDPLILLHSLLESKDVDMAISKHPFNVHTMDEAMATARWKKWGDVGPLRVQMETYCENRCDLCHNIHAYICIVQTCIISTYRFLSLKNK